MFLSACESRLELGNVERALKEPIRRTDLFQAIEIRDSTIIAVARSGVILVSSDKGQHWTRNQLEGWPSFIDITSCTNGNFAALAAEGEVWLSENHGQNWKQTTLDTTEIPQAIACDFKNKLWVVGSFSTISTSEDQGETWQSTSKDEDIILTDIQFIDETHAVIAGEFGSLLTSSDAGINWEFQPPMPGEFYPQDMYFDDSEHGWVVGLLGSILFTEDGGQSWMQQTTDTGASLFGIERVGEQMLVVGAEGVVLGLQDEHWIKLEHGKPVRLHLRSIIPLDSHNFIIAGRAGALHTVDGSSLFSELGHKQ